MSRVSGRCLCGAVTFYADKVETEHHACHCGMCRRWCGGPLLAARVDGLHIEGKESVATYAASAWAERAFCRRCGTSLYYRFTPQDLYFVAVGAFDDPALFSLASEIYIDAKPRGYDFAGERPRLTEAEVLAQFATPDTTAT